LGWYEQTGSPQHVRGDAAAAVADDLSIADIPEFLLLFSEFAVL